MIALRTWIALLAVAMLAFVFAWSERVVSRSAAPDRVTVTYWEKWTGAEGEAMRAVVDEFNRSQDRIYVKMLTVSGVHNKTLLAASGGNPPDVAGLFDWNVTQFAAQNALTPLEGRMRESGLTPTHYIRGYYDICLWEGVPYALPSTPSSTALHVNADHMPPEFRDPESFPKTIEEFTALMREISAVRDGSVERAGFMPAQPGWWRWGFGNIFGGRILDEEGNLTADSPENIRAYEWVQSFSELLGPSESAAFRSGFGNFSSPQNPFMSGKVSTVIQGVWMANFIQMFGGELDWFAVPMPHPADRPDLAGTTYLGLDVLAIPVGAAHPDAAWEFIEFVQSQEGMELLCLGQVKNSPLAEVSDEFWAKHGNPYIRLFDELARGPNIIPPPKIGIWSELQAEMNVAFDKINLMQATPAEALREVQIRMEPRVEEYRERLRARQADER